MCIYIYIYIYLYTHVFLHLVQIEILPESNVFKRRSQHRESQTAQQAFQATPRRLLTPSPESCSGSRSPSSHAKSFALSDAASWARGAVINLTRAT